MHALLRARRAFGFEYLISFRAEHSDAEILRESEIDEIDPPKKENIVTKISEHGFSNFPEN